MARKTTCEACGVDRPKGGRTSIGGFVGHVGSERKLYLCGPCFRDPKARARVLGEAFAGLVKECRRNFRPRTKEEAAALAKRDGLAASIANTRAKAAAR